MSGESRTVHEQRLTRFLAGSAGGTGHQEIHEELNRILSSRFFIKSARLSCFLQTAVSYLLEGKAESFKEYTVGTEVYQRPSTYDPTQDSIVRTEARRLRAKLKDYYSAFPPCGSIKIQLASGSYVPVIQSCDEKDDTAGVSQGFDMPAFMKSKVISVGILPFCSRSTDAKIKQLAYDLEDQLTHHMSQHTDVSVFRVTSSGNSDPAQQLRSWSASGVQVVIHGHVSQFSGEPVAQIQLTTLSGMILWSQRFGREFFCAGASEFAATILTAVLASFARSSKTTVFENGYQIGQGDGLVHGIA